MTWMDKQCSETAEEICRGEVWWKLEVNWLYEEQSMIAFVQRPFISNILMNKKGCLPDTLTDSEPNGRSYLVNIQTIYTT